MFGCIRPNWLQMLRSCLYNPWWNVSSVILHSIWCANGYFKSLTMIALLFFTAVSAIQPEFAPVNCARQSSPKVTENSSIVNSRSLNNNNNNKDLHCSRYNLINDSALSRTAGLAESSVFELRTPQRARCCHV